MINAGQLIFLVKMGNVLERFFPLEGADAACTSTHEIFRSGGEGDGKNNHTGRTVGDLNGAAMEFDDLPDNGETKARAA